MRWIYISPHLDDAILSTGGLMYEQAQVGIQVEIWTIMCGFPLNESILTDFAKILHRQWGTSSAAETIHIRRKENDIAAAIVGAKAVYFDFLDSMYRSGPNGEELYSNSFAKPHKTETDLPAQIAAAISKHLQSDDILVCPLALGEHVDHIMTRKAADLLGHESYFDADIPYLLNKPNKLKHKITGMEESIHAISETGLNFWLDAINAYKSQIAMEFQTPETMRKKISAYWARHRGICLWQIK